MRKAIDLVGQVFGKLTVIERDFSKRGNNAYWLCRCSCGNPKMKSVRSSHLKGGEVKSCGKCLQFEMIGQQFGRLTILSLATEPQNSKGTHFLVQCCCKNKTIFTVSANHLRTGGIKSCGCLNLENHTNDLTGMIFGYLKALYPTDKRSSNHVVWHCICLRDGNECDVRSSRLISGDTQSCGCITSIGEANIQRVLQENNIKFKKEKTFDDLISPNGGYYRYDFYLPDYNRLIEFDGVQHFKETGWDNYEEKFKRTQQSDEIKNNYALSHNIPLVRIPYWERDKITLEILLSDKFLLSNKNNFEEEIVF